MSETKATDYMLVGKNVQAKVDGKYLDIRIDITKDTGRTTEKGNVVIATVGGGVMIGVGKLGLNYYRPSA